MHDSQLTILSLKEVIEMTGRSRSSIQRDISNGRFPPALKTGPSGRGFLRQDVVDWVGQLLVEREKENQKISPRNQEVKK